MPDANGQWQLQDYRQELKRLGFDGFNDFDLNTYVNRGYFHVARKNRWYWEQWTDSFTVVPGSPITQLWPKAGGELPNFRSLDKLYCVTAGHETKLQAADDDDFFANWLSQDLTQTKMQGEASMYYIWNGDLYILAPPVQSRQFVAHYHRRVSVMAQPTDMPITPIHLDEAILRAAKIRAHERAQEWDQAAAERANLEEHLDDMRDDEELLMGEQPTRTVPDNTWL